MKTYIPFCLVMILVLVLSSGCMNHKNGHNKLAAREVVLRLGESVKFRNSNGLGEYAYVDEHTRTLKVGGETHRFSMIARQNRFRGMLGIYNPAAGTQNGPVRVVAVEAEKHFESNEAALNHLIEGSDIMDWVMNCDGYVVGYSETPHRNQINISVFKYYVGSKAAKDLKGCNSNAVRLIGP